MPNYKEVPITGSRWQRCRSLTVHNTFGKMPEVVFVEEELAQVGDAVMQRDVGSCWATFDPLAGSIPLIDPQTGEPLGTTCSHAQLHVILHSLYLQTAAQRDVEAAG